jgi:hypothetical protein
MVMSEGANEYEKPLGYLLQKRSSGDGERNGHLQRDDHIRSPAPIISLNIHEDMIANMCRISIPDFPCDRSP